MQSQRSVRRFGVRAARPVGRDHGFLFLGSGLWAEIAMLPRALIIGGQPVNWQSSGGASNGIGEEPMAGDGGKPDAGSLAGPEADNYVAMVARARALIPALRARASRTEELRRLPPETERDLHDAGLFRIVQPKRVGGAELDYVVLVDCADALAQADASVALVRRTRKSAHTGRRPNPCQDG